MIQKLGVILLLVICIVCFSMSNVSAYIVGHDTTLGVFFEFDKKTDNGHLFYNNVEVNETAPGTNGERLKWRYFTDFGVDKFACYHDSDWERHSSPAREIIDNGGTLKIRLDYEMPAWYRTCWTPWFDVKKGDNVTLVGDSYPKYNSLVVKVNGIKKVWANSKGEKGIYNELILDDFRNPNFGKPINITGILSFNNSDSANKNIDINIKLNGRVINNITVTTGENGKYIYSYPTSKIGEYTVTASFSGEANPIIDPVTKVGKPNNNLKITSSKTGSNVNVKGELTDNNSVGIGNKEIKLTGVKYVLSQGKPYNATVITDKNGKFSYTFKNAFDICEMIATFRGDEYYNFNKVTEYGVW